MANTEINPFAYNTAASSEPTIDPSVEQYLSSMGEPSMELGPVSEDTAGAGLPAEANALLKTISGTESPDYHTIYGGQKVQDLRKHPSIPVTIKEGPNAGKTSTAAGKYQFLKGTWEAQAAKLGLTDFSPKSQDLAAWNLAQETYAQSSNRDLLADLKSKDADVHRHIAKTLAPIWTSLPGGIEQGQDADSYISAYNKNLGGDNQISTIETYDIPLSDGSVLHAPKTATREEALAYARANGITAVGLQDIPLASGDILHAPENVSVEEAIAQAKQFSPDMDFTLAETEGPSRTVPQAVKDIGIGAMKGGVGLGQSLAGLVDILTPGQFGKSLEEHGVDFEKAQQYLDTQYSPQQQEAINNLAQAHGFKNILQAAIENPTAVISMAGESLPQVIGGGIIGAGARLAGLGRFAAAGLGQGATTAGSTAESIRSEDPNKELTTKGQVAALGAGTVEAVLGKYGSEFVTKIGGIDPNLLISGGVKKLAVDTVGEVAETPGFFSTVLKSLVGEGVEEIPQEAQAQMFQNYASGKDILEGVEDAATKGFITGAVTGAGAGAVGSLNAQPAVQPPPPPTTPTPEGTGEIPEPTIRKEGEYEVPEGKHWVDTLGLTASSKPTSAYQQLKQLDINDTEHHQYIKSILDNIASRPQIKQDSAAIENLYGHLDAMTGEPAAVKRETFAGTMGAIAPRITDRLGRTQVILAAPHNDNVKTAVENKDFNGTLDALTQSKNPVVQWIAERTKNLSGVTIRSDAKAIRDAERQNNKKEGTYGGFYRPGTEEVVISPHYAGSEHVVAHELLHANVSHAITTPTAAQRPSVMGLMKLHDVVKNHPTLSKDYGATDVHEFVSEGLSNPDFQYKLHKIKYQNTTLWGKFTQSVADLLGLKRDNAFMELITHVENLMPSKPEHRKQRMAGAVMAQEQENINANKVPEATALNVSRSTQPEVRQEGQGAPISSEGVREGGPETRQAKEEKDLTHLTFGDLGNKSNALQDKIEEIEKRLDDQGMSYEEQDKHPELQKAYAERIGMDTQAAKKGYYGSKAILENVLKGLPEDTTYGSHQGLLRDAFSLSPDAAGGAYMMVKYTGPALNNKTSTIKEMVKHIEPLLLAKSHPNADFHATMGSNMSGLGRGEIDAIHSEAKRLAEESFDKIKDFFTDTVATPKEKQVSAVGIKGPKAEMHFMEMPPEVKDYGKELADSGLVQTSDKTVKDSAKEGLSALKSKTLSGIFTRLQNSYVDSSAGLRRALSKLDTFDMNGKLRADMLHSKTQQLFNIVRTSFETGPVMLSSDGSVMASDNKKLALQDIFKRIDDLGYSDSRKTFFTVMRVLAGEENLRRDAVNRGKARDMLDAANDLELFSKLIQDKVEYKKAMEDASALRKEANKILDRVGEEAEERLGTEKLVTPEQIATTKKLLEGDARLSPIMADIYSLLNASVDLWEKTGLLDKETATEWRDNPAYIPLYKSMDELLDDPNEYIKFLKSGAKHLGEVQRRKGGIHAVNVGENLVKHITFMTGAAAQNQLRKTAVGQLGIFDESVKQTHPNDKQAVMFKVDGKKVFYHIDDPLILEALETAMPSLGAFAKVAQQYTKVFRAATLVNPLYWYRQIIRDPIHANLVSQTGLVTPFHAIKAMIEIIAKKSPSYETLKKHGVVGAVDSLTDPKQFIKAMASKPGMPRKFGDWVIHIHESTDAATRVAVFDAAVKEAKKRGMTNKADIENFAAMRAREIINFSKKGNSQAIANIRATVPFFSSALNSMDTLARAATGAGLNKKEAARAQKMFVTRALVLASVSAAWALHLQDDDDYIKSPDWANSWLIPTGNKDAPFWKIPIPFEAGFFFKVMPELMVRLVSGTLTPKEAQKETGKAALQLLVPPMPLSQILKPALETVTNHDFYTGRPIESVSDAGKTKEQRDSKASDLAKFVSQATPLSPNQMEHLGRGYFTELWSTTAALAENYLHKGPAAPEKHLGEMPFIRGVLTKPEQDRTVNKFYEVEKATAEIYNTVKGARKTGEKSVYEDIMADPEKAKMFRAYPALNSISDRISKLRKNIERIKNDASTTPSEKTNRIRNVQQQINKAGEQGVATAKRMKLDM